jgi:hypothetical protein
MKIVIPASEIRSKNPHVIASYPDSSDISEEAHGKDTKLLVVPDGVLTSETNEQGISIPRLVDNWRDRTDKERPFPLSERVAVLHEMLINVIKNGTDVSKWPAEAKNNYSKNEKLWK